jgi:hypothetical protein
MFSKQGNTAGFTSKGFPVCGAYSRKAKEWAVWVDAGLGAFTNSQRRTFATLAAAEAYARPMIDAQKTAELAWW